MSTVSVDGAGGRRSFDDTELPISLGGASSDVVVPGFTGEGPLAFVGFSDGDFFLQPAPGASGDAAVNGVSLTTSRWLADGDQITLAGVTCGCSLGGGALNLDFARQRADTPSRTPARAVEGVASETLITPVDFTPRWNSPPPRRRFGIRPGVLIAAVLFAALAAGGWFVLTARTVSIVTEPETAEVRLSGGFKLSIGQNHLLRPGTYDLSATHPGYVNLETTVTIEADTPGELRYVLQPLGTELSVSSRPVSGATVSIDDQVIGTTPLSGHQLAAGTHTLSAQAPRHLPYAMDLEIEPGEAPLDLVLDLEPNWAPVTVASQPAGATVLIDGSAAGRTPLTAEVESGGRMVELRLSGFKPNGRRITVTTGEPLDLGSIALDPLDGTLVVSSAPAGATVTIDGQFRGTTPLELQVDPDTDMDVRLTLAGHSAYQTEARVGAGRRTTVNAELEIVTGSVKITSQPPGATVLVDGVERGTTEQVLELAARPHQIELRLAGWVPHTATVTPQPGLLQAVHAELRQEGPAGLPKTIASPQGVELVLVAPARFTMGAPRREPGRRSNEVLREVEITKPFYLAVREVSNQEFREFRSGHRSGGHARQNLEIDHHPVVNVSWQDAARYCNWLSEKAGLTPVYVDRGSSLTPRQPMPNGYRLATEAEWALAARFASEAGGRKYVWGDALPVPANGGNYGDGLPDHGDGHPGTAPVGSYQANPLGIHNLGGNVSEWVQDLYTMTPTSPGTVAKDPMGPTSGSTHVIRGSSWLDSSVTELRLSYRDSGSEPRPDVGFRIARSAQ